MQTLTLAPHYSVIRRQIAPVLRTPLGNGAMQVRRRYRRPLYEFVVSDREAVQSSAEYLYSFLAYHQGDIPFLWSGNAWGNPQTPLFVGIGTGSQTQFFLPNGNITGALVAYANGTAVTVSTLDASVGLITLVAAPAAEALVTAIYTCIYKCVFQYDEVLLTEENYYDGLFRYEGIVLREIVP